MRYSTFTTAALMAAVASTATWTFAQDATMSPDAKQNHATHTAAAAPNADAAATDANAADRAATDAGAMQGSIDRTAADRTLTSTAAPKLPAGVAAQPIDDRADLTDLLGELTNAAILNGGFDDMIERFVDQDRNRLGQKGTTDDEQANATLNGRIDQIRKAFKDKYGTDLNLDGDSATVFTDARFARGEVKDSSQLMKNWPLPATGDKMSYGSRPGMNAADRDTNNVTRTDAVKVGDAAENAANAKPAGAMADSNTATPTMETSAEKANLENGRAIAVGMLPARGNAPAVTVSVVGETTAWKLDIPNRLTVGELRNNLLAHLTACGEMTDQWPADKTEAEAVLARHVLLALYGEPVQAKGAAKAQ